VRLSFDGERALIAEEGGALLVVTDEARIVWASSGAGAARRPGGTYPPAVEVPLEHVAPLAQREAIVTSAIDAEERAGVAARRRDLLARAKSQVQKLRRTLAAVEQDAARAAGASEDRARAELLLPHQSRIPRGAKEARLPDWSRVDAQGNPAELVIPLDPALSAADNAARWLRRAKRYQAAQDRIAARRAEVERGLREAEALVARIAAAADAPQLMLVERELSVRTPAQRRAREQMARLPYRTFRSAGNAPILVGRSAKDNDALTFKVARGNDVWMHVRGMQGSHVVLPGAGEAPDARVLGDGALLATHFSSARGADAAEVAWTRVKHVRKARGAPAGAVTYSQEKTLRVRADAERLRALLESESIAGASKAS
jgi:predicted ribosome quality control (RQC) complex YloA/Tae2 family protein